MTASREDNAVSAFLKKYIIWIIGAALTITTLWLNSKYVPVEDYNALKNEFSQFKSTYDTKAIGSALELQALETRINDISDRLDKKVAKQNQIEKYQNELENELIRQGEQIKYLK